MATSVVADESMEVIGALSGRVDNNLLQLARLNNFDLIVAVVDGVRGLSFLTGVPENDIPNMLRCQYTPVDWAKVTPEVLNASVAFLRVAHQSVTDALKLLDQSDTATVQRVARDVLEFVVETHRAVRRLVTTNGVDTELARDITEDVVREAASTLVKGDRFKAYDKVALWITGSIEKNT